MHTPLVVRWPGRPPGRVARRTSHNDVAPTLVDRALRLRESAVRLRERSEPLLGRRSGTGSSSASYSEFAVIEPERVTIVYPASYEIRDRGLSARRAPDAPRDGLRAAHAGDEPVLPLMAGRRSARQARSSACSCSAARRQLPSRPTRRARARVRVTTDRLDLVFALDGASPVAWRACHPSCAQADGASGTSVRLHRRRRSAAGAAGPSRPGSGRGSPAPALHAPTSPRTRAPGA